ncbi:hypothetical protein [Streptomyces sp. ISL-96]|uniref:hypothetical protein n=1 Tax=Streptomyces sp. ISL-96 TaxID=2819191 RepID=UPI002034B347|nr:hypothetical protein [Streptomyces sp. ISL-96]
MTTRPPWKCTLELLAGRHENVYLDLSDLTFVDVAGARTPAWTAQRRSAGRWMVIQQPPSSRRTLEMIWPDLATIEVTG